MVDNLDRLVRKLGTTMPNAVREQSRKDLIKSGDELVEQMKRLVPRETGQLAGTIEWKWGGGKAFKKGSQAITISAGPRWVPGKTRGRWDLAKLMEFGWVGKPGGVPFFFISYRLLKKRIKSRITRNRRKAIIKAATGGGVGKAA